VPESGTISRQSGVGLCIIVPPSFKKTPHDAKRGHGLGFRGLHLERGFCRTLREDAGGTPHAGGRAPPGRAFRAGRRPINVLRHPQYLVPPRIPCSGERHPFILYARASCRTLGGVRRTSCHLAYPAHIRGSIHPCSIPGEGLTRHYCRTLGGRRPVDVLGRSTWCNLAYPAHAGCSSLRVQG